MGDRGPNTNLPVRGRLGVRPARFGRKTSDVRPGQLRWDAGDHDQSLSGPDRSFVRQRGTYHLRFRKAARPAAPNARYDESTGALELRMHDAVGGWAPAHHRSVP